MTQNPTSQEIFIRLGANASTAHKLVARGLEPWLLLSLDHPQPIQFLSAQEYDEAEDIDEAIAANYPAFDSSVFDRIAQSPWPPEYWTNESLLFIPGPLNRICGLAEAGVHPSISSFISWDLESGSKIIDRIDEQLPTEIELEPVRVVLDDIEFFISIDGIQANEATEAERVFSALSRSPNLAIELLNTWTATTRLEWPDPSPPLELGRYIDIVDSSDVPSGNQPLERLFLMWEHVMLTRLRAVAPTIPD